MLFALKAGLAFMILVAVYFLVVTRVSLTVNSLLGKNGSRAHVYWVYSNRILIWLTDWPVVVSAILLFNYRRITDAVVRRLNPSLSGKHILHGAVGKVESVDHQR